MRSVLIRLPLLVVAISSLFFGGCFLRFALTTVEVNDLGDLIEVSFSFFANDVSAGRCLIDPPHRFQCMYAVETVDGGTEIVSSTRLISEFGFFGILVDPLIVQLPASTVVDRARVDDGSMVHDLVVTETTSFEAQPGVALTAEAGQKFLIFEFPEAISSTLPEIDPSLGPLFDFDVALSWQQATAPGPTIPIKAMFAGRVDAGGETFYPPLLPCVTDFADVPPLNIPVGGPNNIIFDLLFHFLNNSDVACDGTTEYDYTDAGGPPEVPTLAQWSLLAMVLLLFSLGVWRLARARRHSVGE